MLIARTLLALGVVFPFLLPSAAATTGPNPWLDESRRVLNIAHQGGAHEAPSNTLFAFKKARDLGADVLELDVHATSDGHLVVIHDTTVDRTTNGTGRVDQKTLTQIKQLDAAYRFAANGQDTCNNETTCTFPYRGMATGAVEPLEGYFEEDFQIPTLEEVLDKFPEMFINIEIKRSAPDTIPYEMALSDLLKQHTRGNDTIVVSFYDNATELFKLHNDAVSTALGTGGVAAFWATAQGPLPGSPSPRYQALQVPITFEGQQVTTQSFVQKAHANGLAVHVWTINNKADMCMLLGWGVDGIMTDTPTLLEDVLNGAVTC